MIMSLSPLEQVSSIDQVRSIDQNHPSLLATTLPIPSLAVYVELERLNMLWRRKLGDHLELRN